MKSAHRIISRYLQRHAVDGEARGELPPPRDDLRVVVVIPAYDELDTIAEVIRSLRHNDMPSDQAEIIVCVNHGQGAPAEVVEANRATIELLGDIETPFDLHLIDRAGLRRAFAAESAGVGRARRLLMDLATRRLLEAGRAKDGLIACLDGDSPADPGYLDALWQEMSANRTALAGHCRYRHPIPDDPLHARAIISYESWMRYFEAALRLTGTPYAFQSIGSCMVLTARGYALADGVQPREALSDFYLLQKVLKVGGPGSVIQLAAPMVRPSPRPSTRVPRGTGPSVRAGMTAGERRFEWVEPPRAFFELRHFFASLHAGFSHPEVLRGGASPFLTEILERWGAWKTIDKLRAHAPDEERFIRQFHVYFDSLKVVKFANRSKERWGPMSIFDAVETVCGQSPPSGVDDLHARRFLLEGLRARELPRGEDFQP